MNSLRGRRVVGEMRGAGRWVRLALVCTAAAGCASPMERGPDASTDASRLDAVAPRGDGARGNADGDDAPATPADGGSVDGGARCEPVGRWPAPTQTFTLPPVGSGADTRIDYDDVQARFPMVNWTTLERLYIPAGRYKSLRLGNLPVRDPARPLVITNRGGQVFVGANPTGNYIWSMSGGAGWVLTGRYDPVAQTGDERFAGHRCGRYANSAGTYGILSDDEFAFMAPYLHMGLAVSSATRFEIEFVEVRRSGFAGIRLLNERMAGQPERPMADVHVHDVYVHDTGGEGFYFGWTGAPPSNGFPGLEIDNCRIVRTGNDALQIQDLQDGARVHHNVFASGGLDWLANGLGRYQDNNAQITVRSGRVEIDHNLFVDGAGSIGSVWSAQQPGDGARDVTFHDNLFADTLALAVYYGGASETGSRFAFVDNAFRGLVDGYQLITPGATSTTVFGYDGRHMGALLLTNNRWEGTRALVGGLMGGTGTRGIVTAMGNTNTTVPPVAFVDAGYPADNPGHHLTRWAPVVTVVPERPMVTYRPGDVVVHGSAPDLYRCTAMTMAGPPPTHPEAWERLPTPVDDLRVQPGSPYAAMGVR